MRWLLRAAGAACGALLLGACLKDHPLVLPENGYDPAHTLRSDSLARFDTVEILLVDPEDSTVAIRIFRGVLRSMDDLEPQAAGDGRTLVYMVRGWRTDRGHCFTERVTREGAATLLLDTCVKVDTGGGNGDLPKPPRFETRYLSLAEDDTAFAVQVKAFSGPGPATLRVAGYWKVVPYEILTEPGWIRGVPLQLPPERDTTVTLSLDSIQDGPGRYGARLVIESAAGADTAQVFIDVPPPPSGRLFGKVVDWRDSLPQAGWTVRLEGESIAQVTGADGVFDFGKRAPGRHVLALSAEGRIGRTDTVELQDGDSTRRSLAAAPAVSFKEVPLTWSRQHRQLTIAAGRGLIPSSEFEAPGSVAVFPLDNASASLQRFPDQGNSAGDPPEEYFEAGECVADSQALYIAYPEANRLGKVDNWRGAARAMNVALPFQPSGLLLEWDALMVIGRIAQGTMVLAELNPATLDIRRVDTLAGHAWDGVMALDWGPRLVAFPWAWYAVDGNGPTAKGRILRINRISRKVDAWEELPEAGASDLATWGGRFYVTVSAPSAKSVFVYDTNLKPMDTVTTWLPTHRLVFANLGRLSGLGFVAADDNAVLVIRPGEDLPVGRLSLPGSQRARSIDVDSQGRILVTDGDKVFLAEF